MTSETLRQVCLACSANSYPVYAGASSAEMSFTNPTITGTGLPGWYVTSCVQSLNCDEKVITSFNSCSKCDESKEYLPEQTFYGFHDFTLTNCFETSTQNCLILNPVGFSQFSKTNNCLICKSGFFLNVDSVCEKYVVPNQASSSSSFTNSHFSNWFFDKNLGFSAIAAGNENRIKVRITYLLKFFNQNYGVSACTNEFVQFPVHPWSPKVCVWSSYLYDSTTKYEISSKFIKNCIRFKYTSPNDALACGGCLLGYIPSFDGLTCVESESIKGCKMAQSGSNGVLCYECSNNLLNVNGQCVTDVMPNCAEHVNNRLILSSSNSLTCKTCLSGFHL